MRNSNTTSWRGRRTRGGLVIPNFFSLGLLERLEFLDVLPTICSSAGTSRLGALGPDAARTPHPGPSDLGIGMEWGKKGKAFGRSGEARGLDDGHFLFSSFFSFPLNSRSRHCPISPSWKSV